MAAKKKQEAALKCAYSEAFKVFTNEIVDLVEKVNIARTALEGSQDKVNGSFSKKRPISDFEKAEEALKKQIENIGTNPALKKKVGRLQVKIRAVEVELVRQPPGTGPIVTVIVKGLTCLDPWQGDNYSSQSSRHP